VRSRARAAGARLLAAALAGILCGAARAAPLPERGYGLPRDASVDGHRVDSLLHFTLGSTAVVFAAVLALLLFALVKHRGPAHPAAYSHGTRRSKQAVAGSILFIALAVDGSLFTLTELDLRRHFWNFEGAEADPEVVRIEVNAHQWSWAARYPGPDGRFGTPDDVVTTDDIRVPVGAPVVMQLTSTDVIHSLYLPNFRVKQDAVPGNVGRLTFRARVPGEYEIACAQHCGPSHYKMRGVLSVLAPQAYREWLEEASADAVRAYDPDDAEARWGWEWRRF
jgi:cytochrome c oxidase subunit II